MVFFDVGSHIGVYSMLVGTIMKWRAPTIFAFEATPRTATLCRMMRDANDLTYYVAHTAIGSDSGTAEFFLSPKAETSNSLNAGFRAGSEKIVVPLITIDRFVESGAPAPSVIKIDVETLEAEVIAGARKTIAAARPIITCELLPREESRDGVGECLAWLKYYGYRFYRVTPEGEFDEFSASEAVSARNPQLRDWVFSPASLSADYYAALERWRAAMPSSGAETNIAFEPGAMETDRLLESW